MSAVIHMAHQLLRFPTPLRTVRAPATGVLRITGTLERDAEVRSTVGAHPRAMLVLYINTGAGLPYCVQQDMGDTFSGHLAAANRAQALRRGRQVTVRCTGLRTRVDHNLASLVCMGVDDVIPHDTPAARHCSQGDRA